MESHPPAGVFCWLHENPRVGDKQVERRMHKTVTALATDRAVTSTGQSTPTSPKRAERAGIALGPLTLTSDSTCPPEQQVWAISKPKPWPPGTSATLPLHAIALMCRHGTTNRLDFPCSINAGSRAI